MTSATDSPPPKFRRRAEARPDEVLDAALVLFGDQGFARTTVDQIARKAGLSKGAVYLYFQSKEAILEGLVARAIGPVTEAAFDRIESFRGDPRPVIEGFVRLLVGAMRDPNVRSIPLLVIHEAPGAPDVAAMFRRSVLDRALPALSALIAQGAASGHIRAVDPELTTRTIMGPLIAHIFLADIFSVGNAEPATLRRLADNHLSIVFAGLEPHKGGPA